ncbi:MAG: formylglycine-generating enzyme family protein [Alphaproteobacteria bacterium]|nr:formylglycine-generating enzyme family protein [Alphaproteobacteria bacterium]
MKRYLSSLAVGLAVLGGSPALTQPFRDCTDCPEMVVIPAGDFVMGVAPDEEEREGLLAQLRGRSAPRHGVSVASFALGRYEVTVGEFSVFVNETNHRSEGGCWVWTGAKWDLNASKSWRDPGFRQDYRHPVTCVNWADASAYAAWLFQKTGKRYRLTTEAEWEYAARAGTATARPWGEDGNQGCGHANTADQAARNQVPGGTRWATANCDDGHAYTAPVGSFQANAFGLHDMLGNVWEWTADCWNENYAGAPTDGSAWGTGDCTQIVIRGGSWSYGPRSARSAYRFGYAGVVRGDNLGFRVARPLD